MTTEPSWAEPSWAESSGAPAGGAAPHDAPLLARTRGELLDHRFDLGERYGGETAVVPTMGALHAGHVELIRQARSLVGRQGSVLLTVFVNPLQFSAGEDLERYPRDLEADLAVAAEEGVDLVFAPGIEQMYPHGEPSVMVQPGPLGAELEGAVRPMHFAGVLTVVAKLFGLTVPSVAVFGEKDYQQLALVRRMVEDLELGVEIAAVPTVRESDGLALSSRNRYLDAGQRRSALALSAALRAGGQAGDRGPDAVLEAAHAVLDGAAGLEVDYLALRSPDLGPPDPGAGTGEARLLVAARLGRTRLIDNLPLTLAKV